MSLIVLAGSFAIGTGQRPYMPGALYRSRSHRLWITGDVIVKAQSTELAMGALSPALLRKLDAYWRAANYLSVGQIYLYDNPLLKTPLKLEHVKPRLLGHWGTTPGLNFIYVHLNRIIKQHDLDMIYVTGPGHGGPALVANTYLEGTYSEFYPNISQDAKGMRRLFTQFSFPGGVPSHAAAETPGSINEGGELGYSLAHAYGAAFDNLDLIVACVVGDGEAETGPMATSWHSNKFLNPVRDGAVLPILHLNGYKIAGPTVLARIPRDELEALFRGYGYLPYFVEGDEPMAMHQRMAATLDTVLGEIRRIQHDARTNGFGGRPRWPMIILRSPKTGLWRPSRRLSTKSRSSVCSRNATDPRQPRALTTQSFCCLLGLVCGQAKSSHFGWMTSTCGASANSSRASTRIRCSTRSRLALNRFAIEASNDTVEFLNTTACRENCFAASMSRCLLRRKSMVRPCLSTARYK